MCKDAQVCRPAASSRSRCSSGAWEGGGGRLADDLSRKAAEIAFPGSNALLRLNENVGHS